MMTCKAPPAPPASGPRLPLRSNKFVRSPHIFDVHQAIINRDLAEIRRLTQFDLDLGQPIRGTTALSLAVYRGDLEAVKCLAEAGAPLDRRSKDHLERLETPLISSIRLGHWDIFVELVERGASLHFRDFYNQTPLWFAVKEQRLKFVTHLLESGAPLSYFKAMENPVNLAMQFLGYRGRREMALELISAGLPLTQEDFKGHSPLYWAYKHGDLPVFRLLVQAGVPIRPYDWLKLHPANQNVSSNSTANQNSPSDWREQEAFSHWLRVEMATPTSLISQCRAFIRQYLRAAHCTDVRPLLHALPVPPLVLSYLTLQMPLAEAAHNPPTPRESGHPPPMPL